MDKIERYDADISRMEPDCYDGPGCDQLRPRWIIGVDKEGDCDFGEDLALSAKHFPPGARVVIQIPVCPDCGESADMNAPMEFGNEWPDCDCGFSWSGWAFDQYS